MWYEKHELPAGFEDEEEEGEEEGSGSSAHAGEESGDESGKDITYQASEEDKRSHPSENPKKHYVVSF
jgi:hypothetical protein